MTRAGGQLLGLLDVADAGGSMQSEIERLRAETDRRFGPFVLERINPGHRERDRHRIPISPKLLTEPAGLELLRFSLPREWGGEGRSKFEWGIVVERLSYLSRDHAFSVLFDVYVEVTELILSSGAPAVIDRYMPGLVSGRLTAVQAAFESLDPWAWTTTARRTDDGWVLNGTKRFIAAATFADIVVTYVREEESGDILAFVVERGDPGVSLTGLETSGMRSIGFGQMMLTDVLLDESERLMWRADALSELNTYARNGRLLGACGFVGATEAMVDMCVERLGTRVRGGRPVVDYPNVERAIGEMKVAVETARAMLYRALDGIRGPRDPYFDSLATVAKHHAFEAAVKVGQHLMNLHAGEAYMSANPWELFVRDMMSGFGGQGAQELLLMQLGQRAVHGSDMRRVQDDAAARQLAKLCDAWTVVAAAASATALAGGSPHELGEPLREAIDELLEAAGSAPAAAESPDGARAIVEAGAAIVEEARAGELSGRIAELGELAAGAGDGLAAFADRCAAFAALVAALESGVLDDLLDGRAPGDIAARLGASEQHVLDLLERLATANLVRGGDDAPSIAGGLDWLAAGGPRRGRFEHDVRTAIALGLELVGRAGGDGGALQVPATGSAGLLCDHFLDRLLPQLLGLEDRLCAPGARILVSSEELRTEFGRRLPRAEVLDLKDPRVGATAAADGTARFAFAWLSFSSPGRGSPASELSAISGLLEQDGWVVVQVPQVEGRLAEAASRVRSILESGQDIRGAEIETLLAEGGFGGVTTLPGPSGSRTGLLAGRRVTRAQSSVAGT